VKAEEKRKAAGEAAFKERIQEMLNEPLPESAYRAKWNLGDETTS
jgi:hypothetical protein